MKPSQIYLEAAEKLHRRHLMVGCCFAISDVTGSDYESPEHELFNKWFPHRTRENTWGHYWDGLDKNPRVLALLFMSEIAKDSE